MFKLDLRNTAHAMFSYKHTVFLFVGFYTSHPNFSSFFPSIIQFVSSRVACVVEESIVDPEAKTLTTYTRNITFTRLMVVEEKSVYSVHPTNKEW